MCRPRSTPGALVAALVGAALVFAGAAPGAAGHQGAQLAAPPIEEHSALGSFGRALGHQLVAEEALDDRGLATACAAELPPAELAATVIVSAVTEATVAEATEQLGAGLLGGVVVLGSPGSSLAGMLESLHEAARQRTGLAAVVAVDEEGGRVQRLSRLFGPLPSARDQGQLDRAELIEMWSEHARSMAEVGFTVDLAPVVDVGGGPAIGDRSFADDPDGVIEAAEAVIVGLRAGGITPVIKHFPGHGSASADSHLTLPSAPPLDELEGRDLVPFHRLADDTLGVMVAHLDVPGLSAGLPTSLDPALYRLLRRSVGFDGVAMTDALDMGAISERSAEVDAVRLSLQAGADLALMGTLALVPEAHRGVVEAVASGRLAQARLAEAAGRVWQMRGGVPCAVADRWGRVQPSVSG